MNLGVSADIGSSEEESARRLGEVAKLFLDAGHVVISTSNAFHREDQEDLKLLANPYQVVEIQVSSKPASEPDILISPDEASSGEIKISGSLAGFELTCISTTWYGFANNLRSS